MDASQSTPRVNGNLLRQNIGRRVLFVGEVLSLEDGFVRMKAADQMQVTVKVQDRTPFNTKYAEVLGTVDNESCVVAEQHFPFGDSFDMDNYNQLVQLMNTENRDMFM